MKKYILNLTKEELDIIKHSLSIAQLELNSRARNSASFGNARGFYSLLWRRDKSGRIIKRIK